MLSKYLKFLVKDYLFTLFSIFFVIAYWVSAHKLRVEAIRYPIVISIAAGIMIVWNLIFSVKEFREIYKTEGDEKKKWDCSFGLTKGKLIVLGVTIAYIILISVLGYCVSTFLYLAGLSWFLGERKPVKVILFSGVMTGVMYLIFKLWLMVNLPTGFLI